jgi:hypothetical protein
MAFDVDSPMKPIATPPAGNKGGPGDYDGVPGYPPRTSSPNAVPEKVCDGSLPNAKMPTGPGNE